MLEEASIKTAHESSGPTWGRTTTGRNATRINNPNAANRNIQLIRYIWSGPQFLFDKWLVHGVFLVRPGQTKINDIEREFHRFPTLRLSPWLKGYGINRTQP
jgi:hypothetical protein